MKYPKYPEDFNCNRYVSISDEKINDWIKQGIDAAINSPKEEEVFGVDSGDTYVQVRKDSDDCFTINVYEHKGWDVIGINK